MKKLLLIFFCIIWSVSLCQDSTKTVKKENFATIGLSLAPSERIGFNVGYSCAVYNHHTISAFVLANKDIDFYETPELSVISQSISVSCVYGYKIVIDDHMRIIPSLGGSFIREEFRTDKVIYHKSNWIGGGYREYHYETGNYLGAYLSLKGIWSFKGFGLSVEPYALLYRRGDFGLTLNLILGDLH